MEARARAMIGSPRRAAERLHPRLDLDDNAIIIDSLTFIYRTRRGEVRAVDDVSLIVPQGQTVALLGPNGSGKSTLLKAMCGMIEPQRGRVALLDDRAPARARHLLGVVFQSDSLDPHMTVEENLRDQAVLYGLSRDAARDRIDEALEKAALADRRNQLVKSLSRGLGRRVDLCRALLHRPRVVLLDEPTVGLDPSARSSFLAMLEERRQEEDLTIVMSTHLIDEADRADRVVLMHDGRIVADDAPDALRRNIGARLVTVQDAAWSPPDESWRRARAGWTAALPENGERAARIASALASEGVSYSLGPPTLADVFEHYTGRALEENDRGA